MKNKSILASLMLFSLVAGMSHASFFSSNETENRMTPEIRQQLIEEIEFRQAKLGEMEQQLRTGQKIVRKGETLYLVSGVGALGSLAIGTASLAGFLHGDSVLKKSQKNLTAIRNRLEKTQDYSSKTSMETPWRDDQVRKARAEYQKASAAEVRSNKWTPRLKGISIAAGAVLLAAGVTNLLNQPETQMVALSEQEREYLVKNVETLNAELDVLKSELHSHELAY